MSHDLTYLFVAFLIAWLVIGGYLWILGRQVKNLRDEVESLTADDEAMLTATPSPAEAQPAPLAPITPITSTPHEKTESRAQAGSTQA